MSRVLFRAVDDVPLGVLKKSVGFGPPVTREPLERLDGIGARGAGPIAPLLGVVRIPEQIPELVGRIQPALEGEELLGTRIRLGELGRGRLRLIRQIIGAANREDAVQQLAGPHPHRITRRLIGSLLVVHDERKDFPRSPGEQRNGVGKGVSDRDVDDIDPVSLKDRSHGRNERVESSHRNEVLLQHVRRGRARARLELRDVITRLVISPHYRVTSEDDRVDHVLADPFSGWCLGNDPVHHAIEPVGPIRGYEPLVNRRRRSCRPEGRRVDGRVVVRVNVGVVKHGARGVANMIHEVAAVRPGSA